MCRQASLRRTFNAIDHDSKGHINEQDLALYARANGLPVSYVKSFVSAVLQQSGSKQTDSTGAAAPVTFEAFQAFVGSRERALREAFDLFDRGESWLLQLHG
jgi:Ca2+-binding EF-hand superfamily protein